MLCAPSLGLSKYIETKLQTSCFYLLGFFKKQKVVWNYSPYLIFYIIFKEKYFSCYILLTDQASLSGCIYFVRCWVICVFQLFVNQVVYFEIKVTLTFQKIFAKLQFFPSLFERMPSLVCLVFKIENKWILKLYILFSWKTGWFKKKLYQAVTFRIMITYMLTQKYYFC